ncbi:telomere stability and silencing-domain-containing protein [Paraphysoderma sedebokerense]|nr:telomere stability and silencing-domain-containing protein [Paraphysoderma sedebokerense]
MPQLFISVPFLSRTLCLSEDASSLTLNDIHAHIESLTSIPSSVQRLTTSAGRTLHPEYLSSCESPICLTLQLRVEGGKGGFGSMLRAQGGRMASQKTTNFDSCRDLSGRRLKTVKEAQKLADYISQESEREKAKKELIEKKIEAGLKEPPAKKIRFDDTEYFKEKEEMVEGVKGAVKAGMFCLSLFPIPFTS